MKRKQIVPLVGMAAIALTAVFASPMGRSRPVDIDGADGFLWSAWGSLLLNGAAPTDAVPKGPRHEDARSRSSRMASGASFCDSSCPSW